MSGASGRTRLSFQRCMRERCENSFASMLREAAKSARSTPSSCAAVAGSRTSAFNSKFNRIERTSRFADPTMSHSSSTSATFA